MVNEAATALPEGQQGTATSRPPRKRKGWSRFFWGSLVILGGLFLFLPTGLGYLATSPEALAWISGQPAGRVQVGKAMLGWQSPILLRDVVYNDDKGRPLAQVDSVTTRRSFWDFLTKPKGGLQLTLDGLRLTVVVENPGAGEGGSIDLHHAVQSVQKQALPAIGPEMDLTITNGVIEFRTPEQEVIEVWKGWNATYQASLSGGGKQTIQATLPPSTELQTGELVLSLDRSISEGPARQETASLKVQGDRVSLRPAQPWLIHFLGPQQAFHQASGSIQALFERNPEAGWQLVSTVAVQDPSHAASKIDASVECRYAVAENQISLARFDASAPGAALQARGVISDVSGQQMVDLAGRVETPGSPLLDLLPEEIRREVEITGMKISEITLQGALAPKTPETPPLSGSLVLQWEQVAAYGMQSPAGALRVSLQNGRIVSTPMNVTVNGGRLLALPVLDMSVQPAVVRFQPGVMLENVTLTESVCRNWMKFVSPVLADATSAEGRFTLAMGEGVYVIGNPEQTQLQGTLTLFDGRVTPGPLAVQIFSHVGQLEQLVRKIGGGDLRDTTLLEIPQEDVNFVLARSRVFHDEFGVMIRNMRVATSGSVGLDQTLDLKVMMPIPDKWLENAGPILQALRGEAIELLVQGTLQNPQVDARPVAEFGKRIGAKAAGGLIEKLIERRLQRGK